MITNEQVEQLRDKFKKDTTTQTPTNNGKVDVEAYLNHYGMRYKVKQNGKSTIYALDECLFDPDHTQGESSIIQLPDGKLLYQCFHNSCQGKKWEDARKIISGTDSLAQFMSLSHCLPIYSSGQKDNKDYQGFTECQVGQCPDNKEDVFDPYSVLKRGSELLNLDIHVEWVIDKLIPKESIILLHGRGGIGKTWLTLIVADAVSKGIPFMGQGTVQSPVVFVDFENSFPVLVERVKKLQAGDVLFWHNTNEVKPPKIDSQEWDLYKKLPVGLIIYDTLRASQTKDENDSRQMAFVMSRLKELRDMGFTILLLHHTPKGNEQTYKGSTAILDLADHVLSLHKVRKGTLEETDDEDSETPYYRFGTKSKTRYEPFHIFIEFNNERGFMLAEDPDTNELEEIYELLKEAPEPLKQGEVFELVKTKLGIHSKGKLIKLLNKGTGKYWEAKKDEGKGRAIRYCPIVPPYIYKDSKTIKEYQRSTEGHISNCPDSNEQRESIVSLSTEERTISERNKMQTVDSSILSDCPEDRKTERTETIDGFIIEEDDIPEVEGERWQY
ncbi:MAG: AAA family ATPase [Proteobacteria bacterium]|nr:AAA family ATPase [Pseudomonadota bacterium]